MGDWVNPYLTLAPRYEAEQLRAFAQIIRNGHLYKGFKPVHWCLDCRSALAEAEVEYEERTSPSIDVRFEAVDAADLAGRFGLQALPLGRASIVIWTTTPWTLPANQAVAVHPEFDYSLLRVSRTPQLDDVAQRCRDIAGRERAGADRARRVRASPRRRRSAACKGAALEHLQLRHPFYDRVGARDPRRARDARQRHRCRAHRARVTARKTSSSARSTGSTVDNPVGGDGRFLPATPIFAGEKVFEANKHVVEVLRETRRAAASRGVPAQLSALLAPQDAGDLPRDAAVVHQHGAGRAARRGARGDRQGRVDARLGRAAHLQHDRGPPRLVHLAPARLGRAARAVHAPRDAANCIRARRNSSSRWPTLVAAGGIDAWFDLDPASVLGAEAAAYEKVTDIMDVWVDSGVSHHCVSRSRPEIRTPADLYLEGSDQHRGWFHSSLLTSVAQKGHAPYKGVLTHGFTVDEKGRKMSKSLGNAIAAAEGHEHARRRRAAPVGRGHRLRQRDQRLGRDPEAHVRFLPPHPQHGALPARQPGRLRPGARRRAGRADGRARPLGAGAHRASCRTRWSPPTAATTST